MNDPEDVDRLRAEVEDLRARLASDEPPAARVERPPVWRTAIVALLVVIGALAAPLTVVATWVRDEIGDPDRYVDTVAPLSDDPAVQDAMVNRITTEILTRIDVPDRTSEVLTSLSQQDFVPPRAGILLPALAAPLSDAIESFIEDKVRTVVMSDAFDQAWAEANRQASTQLVAVLTGEGSESVQISGGAVQVNLAAFVDAVKQRLLDQGFRLAARIPEVNASFTLIQSDNLEKAQTLFSVLDTTARALPIIGLACLVAAWLIARERRRTLIAIGICIAVLISITGIALNVARPLYLDALPESVSQEAAGAIFDQVVSFLRMALRAVLVIALAIALAAFVSAPTGKGAAVRRGIVGGLGRLRNRTADAGMTTGPVGEFFGRNRTFIRWVIIGAGVLWYISLEHPTGRDALIVVIVVVVLLLVAEFLGVSEERSAVATTTDEERDHIP